MKKNERAAIIKLLGGIGFLILLGAIFTNIYSFNYGLLGAFVFWILAGVISAYYGEDKKKSRRRR